MPLGVKKLCYDARLPTRGSDGAVGYDLYSSEDATVPCQAGRALVEDWYCSGPYPMVYMVV